MILHYKHYFEQHALRFRSAELSRTRFEKDVVRRALVQTAIHSSGLKYVVPKARIGTFNIDTPLLDRSMLTATQIL